MSKRTDKKENKLITIGFRVKEDTHEEAISKAGPARMSDILRALLDGWLNGDILLVWKDGKYRVEK